MQDVRNDIDQFQVLKLPKFHWNW